MMPFTDFRDRPVFICGHPKSGTSLLRNLLDSHPQLVVYPEETGFFRRFLKEAAKLDLEAQLDLAEEKLLHIFEWNQENPPAHQKGFPDRDYSAISYEKTVSAMHKFANQAPLRHSGDILSASVLAFGDVSEQKSSKTLRWVEKSPYNEYFTKLIFSWWPDARCIHIVRDPRDNFVSYSRKQKSWTAEFFVDNWMKSTRVGMENQEKYTSKRYWLAQYKSLVQNPAQFIIDLCKFLGLENSLTLRVPTRVGVPWVGNSMFSDSFEQISAAPVGRWKEKLPAPEVAVIEIMAKKLMQEYEYFLRNENTVNDYVRAIRFRLSDFFHMKFGRGRKAEYVYRSEKTMSENYENRIR